MAEETKKETEKIREKSGYKKLTSYLRELSIVVAGIAITFIASNWISSNKEQSDLREDLEAIKTELQDNLNMIRQRTDFYERTARASRYLSSDKLENLNGDSIAYYLDGILGQIFMLTYKTSAFETFKSSGSIRVMRNKKLSRSIMDSYTSLESTKNDNDNYMTLKMDIVAKTALSRDNYAEHPVILVSENKQLFRFFANYFDIEKSFQSCAEHIENTLTLLETEY